MYKFVHYDSFLKPLSAQQAGQLSHRANFMGFSILGKISYHSKGTTDITRTSSTL